MTISSNSYASKASDQRDVFRDPQLSSTSRSRRAGEASSLAQYIKLNPGSFDGASKLSVCDKGLTSIDKIAPSIANAIETLYLSNNNIAKLSGLTQFKNLRVLSIANNTISDFSELEHLSVLTKLEVLNLEFNPCTQLPSYRANVIARLPRLKVLDAKNVTAPEVHAAPLRVAEERTQLQLMVSNEVVLQRLRGALQRHRTHKEMHIGGGRPQTGKVVQILASASSFDEAESIAEKLRVEVRKRRNKRMFSGGSDRWEDAYADVLSEQQKEVARILAELEADGTTVQISKDLTGIREQEQQRQLESTFERQSIISELQQSKQIRAASQASQSRALSAPKQRPAVATTSNSASAVRSRITASASTSGPQRNVPPAPISGFASSSAQTQTAAERERELEELEKIHQQEKGHEEEEEEEEEEAVPQPEQEKAALAARRQKMQANVRAKDQAARRDIWRKTLADNMPPSSSGAASAVAPQSGSSSLHKSLTSVDGQGPLTLDFLDHAPTLPQPAARPTLSLSPAAHSPSSPKPTRSGTSSPGSSPSRSRISPQSSPEKPVSSASAIRPPVPAALSSSSSSSSINPTSSSSALPSRFHTSGAAAVSATVPTTSSARSTSMREPSVPLRPVEQPRTAAPRPVSLSDLSASQGKPHPQHAPSGSSTTSATGTHRRTTSAPVLFDDEFVQSLQTQVALLQQDIERRVSAEERLTRINTELRRRLEEYHATNEDNVKRAEEELTTLQDEIGRLQVERERLESTLRHSLDAADAERRSLQMRVETLESGLTGKDREAVNAIASARYLEDQLQRDQTALNDCEARLKELQSHHDELQRDRELARSQAEQYRTEWQRAILEEQRNASADAFCDNHLLKHVLHMWRVALFRHRQTRRLSRFHARKIFHAWQRYTILSRAALVKAADHVANLAASCFRAWMHRMLLLRVVKMRAMRHAQRRSHMIMTVWHHWAEVERVVKHRFAQQRLKRTFGAWRDYALRFDPLPSSAADREMNLRAVEFYRGAIRRAAFRAWLRWVRTVARPHRQNAATADAYRAGSMGLRTLRTWRRACGRQLRLKRFAESLSILADVQQLQWSFVRWAQLSRGATAIHGLEVVADRHLTQKWLTRMRGNVALLQQRRRRFDEALSRQTHARARRILRVWHLVVAGNRKVRDAGRIVGIRAHFENLRRAWTLWKGAHHAVELARQGKLKAQKRAARKALRAWNEFSQARKAEHMAFDAFSESHETRAIKRMLGTSFQTWLSRASYAARVEKVLAVRDARRARIAMKRGIDAFVRNALDNARNRMRQLGIAIDSVQAERDAAGERATAADIHNLELVDRIQQLASDKAQLVRSIETIEQQRMLVQQQLEDHVLLAQSLRTELTRAVQEKAEFQQQVSSLTAAVVQHTDDAAAGVVAEQQMELQQAAQDAVAWRRAAQDAQNEMAGLRTALSAREDRIAEISHEYEGKLHGALELVAQLRSMIEERDGLIAELRASRDEASLALQDTQGSARNAQMQLKNVQQAASELEARLMVCEREKSEALRRAETYAEKLDDREALVRKLQYEVSLLSAREDVQHNKFVSAMRGYSLPAASMGPSAATLSSSGGAAAPGLSATASYVSGATGTLPPTAVGAATPGYYASGATGSARDTLRATQYSASSSSAAAAQQASAGPVVDPELAELQARIRSRLGMSSAATSAAPSRAASRPRSPTPDQHLHPSSHMRL
jgi:hypothetical protein